ncbi:MAG: hypothetical protein H0T89_15600 [Deltaproteobacteria bacterium]|nr:hypothetical protein [Deltaproteobacteria bacterium]MDQ3298745.1 hypothetical protein [Myxococcota bacterium]
MQGSKWFVLSSLVASAVFGTACGGPEGRPNNGGADASTSSDGNNGNGDGCSDAAKSVYVVDQNNTLSRFDPPTKVFTDLGQLNCPAGGGATPFSMGVDRSAVAWVLYSNGKLFRVETTVAGLPCTQSAWATQSGLAQFGMGFSTDAAGGSTDTLFIAGGTGPTQPTSQLARLSTSTFTPSPVGTVQGWPELTGTGNAELWGFFPNTSASRIVKLDKTTGAALTTFPLSGLSGMPTAWAFAFHGGKFWVFLMKDLESATTVYQIDAATGVQDSFTRTTGRTIVGAGVSTCAPVIL